MKTTHPKLLAAAAFLLAGSFSAFAAERKAVVPADGPKPVGPYTPGILVGDYLYVSGQGARSPQGGPFAEAPEDRVRQCLENVKSIVTAAGLSMEHIVYTQVYLHKSVSYDALNKVWVTYFPKNPPARATLGVHRMPTETTVEISAVATTDLARKKIVYPSSFPKLGISPGVMVGDRLYISGFLGRDPVSGKIPDAPAAQVQLALDRMKAVLNAAGMDFRHMVFVNPYLTSAVPMNVMNEVYAKHFEFGNTPARATIPVAFLPHDGTIEFTGVAIKDLSKRRAVRPKNMAPSPTASPCVWADDTLYCSAKSAFIPGPNSGIWADNVEDQVRMSLRNLLDGLEEGGLDFSKVVASNVYVDNLDEFGKMNAVYAKYFGALAPTRTTVSPLAPVERKRNANGTFPKLEEVSVVAVK